MRLTARLHLRRPHDCLHLDHPTGTDADLIAARRHIDDPAIADEFLAGQSGPTIVCLTGIGSKTGSGLSGTKWLPFGFK